MNGYGLFSPIVCGRLCQTLLHSMWQITLMAFAVQVWELRRKPSAEQSYIWHVAAIIAGLATMPLTYALVGDAANGWRKTTPVVAAAMLVDRAPTVTEAIPSNGTPDFTSTADSNSSSHVPPAAISPYIWLSAAPWLAAMYFVGVALMLLRLITAWIAASRLGARARPLTDGPLVAIVQSCARRWSMRLVPPLTQTERIVSPKVIGLLRPTILLPAAAVNGLTVEQLRLILHHELAHVRRHDMWIVLIQRLAETALFYHPALWHLSRRISTLREDCCDDIVCRADEAPEPQLLYAAALVRLVELAAPRRIAHVDMASLAASSRSPSELRRRVARLLGEPIREPVRFARGMVWTAAIGALLLAFTPTLPPTLAQPDELSAEAKQTGELEDEAKQKGEPTPKTQPADAEAKNHFSFGGKVEILAIGTHDENPDHWWDAEGKPLVSLPAPLVGCYVPQWDDEGKRLPSLHFVWRKSGPSDARDDVAWRRIVFRIRDLPDSAQATWELTTARASGSGEVTIHGERSPKGYFSRYVAVAANEKSAALKVGVAAGDWMTEGDTEPFVSAATGGAIHDIDILFPKSLDTPDGAVIYVSHTWFGAPSRLVAVDKRGVLHVGVASDSAAARHTGRPWICQLRGTFPKLKCRDIGRFEFQTREYEYVEIKGLPLEPTDDGK